MNFYPSADGCAPGCCTLCLQRDFSHSVFADTVISKAEVVICGRGRRCGHSAFINCRRGL